MTVRIINSDCLTALPQLAAEGVRAHCVVTDPPYHLTSIVKRFGAENAAPAKVGKTGAYARASAGFMGQQWDGGDIALRAETWAAVRECMLPGAHLLAFGGTRTFHRMACAIEDAGFEIRDTIMWVYGSGFPKSMDVSKAIDKAAGELGARGRGFNVAGQNVGLNANRELRSDHPDYSPYAPATPEAAAWSGWGTALKPSHEPVIIARKPLGLEGEWVTIAELTFRLWSRLWLMLPASAAAEFSGLSPSVCGVDPSVSAQWNADDASNTRDAFCARMDTLQFVSVLLSSLSTVSSWNSTLVDRCSQESTYTTGTASSTITDLRTLRFSLSRITPATIIQAHRSGVWSSADACNAAKHLSATVAAWNATRELSALAPAIEMQRLASLDVGATPNFEPIIVARKPLSGTVAATVLAHGTGALNIDACRVEAPGGRPAREVAALRDGVSYSPNSLAGRVDGSLQSSKAVGATDLGRWPANVIHDGSPEVEEAFAAFGESTSVGGSRGGKRQSSYAMGAQPEVGGLGFGDTGSASRFFYSCKADASDRAGSKHPTVKPTSLCRWLVALVCPPGGTVLDPFAGTGSTGLAADQLGFDAILIERDAQYAADAERKIKQDAPLFADVPKPTPDLEAAYQRSLFAEAAAK